MSGGALSLWRRKRGNFRGKETKCYPYQIDIHSIILTLRFLVAAPHLLVCAKRPRPIGLRLRLGLLNPSGGVVSVEASQSGGAGWCLIADRQLDTCSGCRKARIPQDYSFGQVTARIVSPYTPRLTRLNEGSR